jgi:hypothetical protein
MQNQVLAGFLRHLAQVIDPASVQRFSRAKSLRSTDSLPTRMRELLRDGEKTIAELETLTAATREHIERTIRRNPDLHRARRADGAIVVRLSRPTDAI